jgi:hypothetical protein
MEKKYQLDISMLDTDSATEVIEIIADLAEANNIDWALCGEVAMQVYGSPRLTKDIDFIASQTLPLPITRRLSFGGERYSIKTSRQVVEVDWIKRFDDWKDLYQTALQDATKINGVPIITPEWLVLFKWFANRYKDQEDAIFLLRQKGLVNRKLLKENYVKVRGHSEWTVLLVGLSRWLDHADRFVRDGDENESYRTEDEYLDS